MFAPRHRGDLDFLGNAIGGSIQPATQRFPLVDRPPFPGQQEKRCLKGILRIVAVVQHTLTHSQHEPAVALDQLRKSSLVSTMNKALKQKPIRFLHWSGKCLLQWFDHVVKLASTGAKTAHSAPTHAREHEQSGE
jgi:hypothetical protein